MNKILYVFSFFIAMGNLTCQKTLAQDFRGVADLTQRVAPWTKDKIVFHSLPEEVNDRFELETVKDQLHIYATTPSAAAMGFNYYLNRYCHQVMSHGADNLRSLDALPEVRPGCVIETPFNTGTH
jgi:hypothetical protein